MDGYLFVALLPSPCVLGTVLGTVKKVKLEIGQESDGELEEGACSGKVSVCDTKGSEGERLLGQGIPALRP